MLNYFEQVPQRRLLPSRRVRWLPMHDYRREADRINLQMVRTCQPAFSAALLAYVESHVADNAEKNALCGVTPNPTVPADWPRMWAVTLSNRMRWGQHPGLLQWMARSRLDAVTGLLAGGGQGRRPEAGPAAALWRRGAPGDDPSAGAAGHAA